jgi:hypothetical protein
MNSGFQPGGEPDGEASATRLGRRAPGAWPAGFNGVRRGRSDRAYQALLRGQGVAMGVAKKAKRDAKAVKGKTKKDVGKAKHKGKKVKKAVKH